MASSRLVWKDGDLKPYTGPVRKTMRESGRLREDGPPDEPRDDHGRWTDGGGDSGITKDPVTGVPDHTAAIVADIKASGLSDGELVKAIADGRIADTLTRNSTNGTLNNDRAPLHEAGVSALQDDHASQPEGERQALFTAGAPASGKSGLYGDAGAANGMTTPADYVPVDADAIKTGNLSTGGELQGYNGIPEFAGVRDAGYPEAASAIVHEESSQMAAETRMAAMAANQNMVVDALGGGDGKFAMGNPNVPGDPGKIGAALNNGYQVEVRYADVPVETSLQSAITRAEDPTSPAFGRTVPVDTILNAHQNVSSTYITDVAPLAHSNPNVTTSIYARNGSVYSPVANIDAAGNTNVTNAEAYNAFLTKANR